MALKDNASLALIPAAYKTSKIYSAIPTDGDGDFTFTRSSSGTRINKAGLIETMGTNVPRLNYRLDADGNPSSCPELLLEPERTNQISKSRDFEGWQDLGGSETVTNNNATAPDGANTAATIEKTGSDNSTLRFYTTYTNYSTVRSASIYIKKLSGNPTVSFGITDTQDSITPTNEWVRYTKDNVTPSDFGVNIFVDIEVSGVSGDKIAVWGAQLEEGTYSTSVIETTGIILTRTNDFISNSYTGLTGTSGTIFIDFDTKGFDSSFSKIIALRDTVTTDTLRLEPFDSSGTKKFAFFGINGSSATPPSEDILPIGTPKKIALTFDSGNFKYASDGVITTGTYSGTARQYNQVGGANITGGAMHNGIIKQFMVFNEVLTNAQLIELTS